MGFQVRPQNELLIRPSLPEAISRLEELAYNVVWSWDHNIRSIFRRLDPVLWRTSGRNPVLMLSRLPAGTLERAAADPRFLTLYRRTCARFDSYVARPDPTPREKLIAYFCMEFGVVDCMPIYSGGLGVLSGDHLKAASDLDLPLVAIGLLYQKGYLRQLLNPDGWQQERYPVNDFYLQPIQPVEKDGVQLKLHLDMAGQRVAFQVWKMNVGRVTLHLLDTNLEENPPEYRDITDQLYGGDLHTRIRQEIILGIGGLRVLKALGMKPTVYHMNEGHSAFLALERIRLLMAEQGLSFEEAHEASRQNNVFTTHTSVPAGFDLFDESLLRHYFGRYCEESGIRFDQFLALGRPNPLIQDGPFSMAISAIQTSAWRNAVSVLHKHVSQDMFQHMWPALPAAEVPITSVTNGVHLPGWLSPTLGALYDQYLQPDWVDRMLDQKMWAGVSDIPDTELWEAHRRRKRRLIGFVRERAMASAQQRHAPSSELHRLAEVLEPDVFTIGFARRFATYKRATLLFRDLTRLKKLLNNPDRPVQIIVAGKAHPKDTPGKAFIREIAQLARDPEISHRLVFVEDYSLQLARELVQGVDLWLNNPRRGEEACGTSGMKAALNGVLNFSVLDGWFDEAYEFSGGWAIGDRVPYSEDQDSIHASGIYSTLENEIVPLFYQDRERGGVPEEWVRRMKQSIANMSPWFSCLRMLTEYDSLLYQPAHDGFRRVSESGFAKIREHEQWMRGVRSAWDRVRVLEVGPKLNGPVLAGQSIDLTALAHLGGLTPGDIRVEALVGPIAADGHLDGPEVVELRPSGQTGDAWQFAARYLPGFTGRIGVAVRIAPNHTHGPGHNPLTRPCHALIKWG